MSNFTSRLPMSTIRRPTHTSTGSTSFVGLQRPSNIPVTVRKANLFTPQTKRPTLSSTSAAGKSYMTTDKKYKKALKPAPEKEEQLRMFNRMIEFLKANAPHMPQPDLKKFFSSISTTESSRLFELLIGMIIPDFKITRLEIDVPEALSQLDYPYIRTVTKSALVSVTTRQAVVGLLVIFDWLVDTIECNISPLQNLQNIESDDQVDAMFELDVISLSHLYEDAEKANFKLLDWFFPTENDVEERGELEEVDYEIERLACEIEKVEELDLELKTFRGDREVCEKFKKDMLIYIENKKAEKDEKEIQLGCREQQVKQLREQKVNLSSRLSHQSMNLEDFKSYQSEQKILEKTLHESKERLISLNNKEKQAIELQKVEEDRLLEKATECFNQLKGIYNILDSTSFNTETLSNLKMTTRQYALEFEQLIRSPSDSLNINQDSFFRLKTFIDSLISSSRVLEREFGELLAEPERELDKLRHDNEKAAEDAPHIEIAIHKKENEIKGEQHVGSNALVDLQNRLKSKNERLAGLVDKFSRDQSNLEGDLRLKTEHICNANKELEADIDLKKKHIDSLIQLNSLKMTSCIEEAHRLRQKVDEHYNIAKENKEITKTGFKLIRRQLSN